MDKEEREGKEAQVTSPAALVVGGVPRPGSSCRVSIGSWEFERQMMVRKIGFIQVFWSEVSAC